MNTRQASQLKAVHEALASIPLECVFLGGSVIPLLVDQPQNLDFRETLDVDVVVQVAAVMDYASIEASLREKGFQHDTRPGAPICRWRLQEATVDIMPTDGSLLGLNTRWFKEALLSPQLRPLPLEGSPLIPVVTPEFFIITKLEAFMDRGKGDYYSSHDLEDIVTVIDNVENIQGRFLSLPQEVLDEARKQLSHYLADELFVQALPGHLLGGPENGPRFTRLLAILKNIATQTD